jgi:hypothetical protein
MSGTIGLLALGSVALGPTPAAAQYQESEANDTKATADAFAITNGSTITGSSQGQDTGGGATSRDYYRLDFSSSEQTPAGGAPAIYENAVTITSSVLPSGLIVSFQGLSQTNRVIDPASDLSLGGSQGGILRFYTVGTSPTSMYYAVRGQSVTTAPYTINVARNLVTPSYLGAFSAGSVVFTTDLYAKNASGQQLNTTIGVFDQNLSLVNAGSADVFVNDNVVSPAGGDTTGFAGLGSTLIRDYQPGRYYLAVGYGHMTNSAPAAADDRNASPAALDFAGALFANSPGLDVNGTPTVRAYNGTTYVAPGQSTGTTNDYSATILTTSRNEIRWFMFDVQAADAMPEPSSLALALLAAVGSCAPAARRRFAVRNCKTG